MSANPFTPEEDRLISAISPDAFAMRTLAERLGRSTSVLGKRRKRLLGVEYGEALTRRRHPYRKPAAAPRASLAALARFARPAFFDEDLTAMTKGAL